MKRLLVLFIAVLLLACLSPVYSEQKLPYLDPTLPVAVRVHDLISRMTIEEKISQIVVPSTAIARLGIPEYDWRGECLHGLWSGEGVTCFPQSIGMGATFDGNLIHEVATAISDEARAQYHYLESHGLSSFRTKLTYWAPNINLYRDPRWGRGQETYSEDPYLTEIMGVNFVRGLQGDDPKYLKVACTPKHYAVHSGPDTIRTHFCATVNPHDFWDSYMPHFEAAIKEGKAAGVMAAYSGVNGVPCHANHVLLDTILRKLWGFDGFVVSDGGGVNLLMTNHKYTHTPADTAKATLEAGIDLENQVKDYPELVKLVREKAVSEKRVDEALTNLYTIRFRLGMFDPPEMVPYTKLPYSLVGCPKHHRLALQTARESIVLLKNDGTLPIERGKYKKIAVVGPFADSAKLLYGNYFAGNPSSPVSILDGIREATGPETEVVYAPGCPFADGDILNRNPIPAEDLIPDGAAPGQHGLRAEYFNNKNLTGKPALTRIDHQVNFNWKTNAPAKGLHADNFSVRWTGKLAPTVSGHYRIMLSGDDGIRLYLDNKLVIDQWQNGNSNKGVYEIDLTAGKQYDLRVEYYEAAVQANVHLGWENDAVIDDNPLATAVKTANEADIVIATVGLRSDMSTEGRDWPSYALPATQQKLLEALKATGKPVVVVLIGGNALDLTWEHQNVDAMLQAWFPGEEGGRAVADVIYSAHTTHPADFLSPIINPSISFPTPPITQWQTAHIVISKMRCSIHSVMASATHISHTAI